MDEEELEGELENKNINEEYKLWKKNAPYLYDAVVAHALEWPTLTVQWFPDKESPANKFYSIRRLLLGTHTSGQSRDYLQIATVQLPNSDSSSKSSEKDKDNEGSQPQSKLRITQRINHKGEVNRARYMPQNPDLIATKSVSGSVLFFDRTKHALDEAEKDGVCRPELELVGQELEGFGLDWNTLKQGHVLSASNDMSVGHWDINATTTDGNLVEPVALYTGHKSVVGDVSWNALKENVFASVGDDKQLMIWDTRDPSKSKPKLSIEAHETEILTVAFSPHNETLLLTGASDNTIALWDTRSLSSPSSNPTPLHTFPYHTSDILSLSWHPSPTLPYIFASASADRRIAIWDISAIGMEQSPDDAEDGASELLFVHGGHTNRPTDLAWAGGGGGGNGGGEEWWMASAAEDNVVQVWKMSEGIYARGMKKVDDMELE